MQRNLILAYGAACYALFLAVFLYLVAFLCDVAGLVPKTVSSGEPGAISTALLVNTALLLLFGVQHSVMPRPAFKRWITGWLPQAMERSTYVLATSAVLILMFVYWQPLPGMAWQVAPGPATTLLWSLNALGWVLVLIATFLTNHFDLFGLRQVWLQWVQRSYAPVPFREVLLYRWVRHPMMVGLFIAFWSVPSMSLSHLMFSLGMSIYIVVGVHYEERGLRAELGAPYREYAARTGRFLPRLGG
jgi:protein-S-isoprenylcysteine O-methyltransferase Ste14